MSFPWGSMQNTPGPPWSHLEYNALSRVILHQKTDYAAITTGAISLGLLVDYTILM